MDKRTQRDINTAVEQTLEDAGIGEPAVRIEDVLERLALFRDYYDLEDPSLLQRFWHKVKVRGHKLIEVGRKIKLAAVWLPDENRILVDSSLPSPKQEWASFHDAVHRILDWHRPFYLGDTAQTLDPSFQEELEAEANYGASALMFCGQRFTRDALDVSLDWSGVDALRKRYGGKSYATTLRRFVGHGRDHTTAMLVSTPWWADKPPDQERRWRHFVPSPKFARHFSRVAADEVLDQVEATRLRGSAGRWATSRSS